MLDVYKTPDQVSWTQVVPRTSLNFIHDFELPKSSILIDMSSGDSNLVDFLLRGGYLNITKLEISEAAFQKPKARLGHQRKLLKWAGSDITEFKTDEHFDLWHDRVTFHFSTQESQMATYLKIAGDTNDNFMVVGAVCENGRDKCSGLPISQYSENQLQLQLQQCFEKIKSINCDHIIPFQTRQNFLFCSFKKQSCN